MAMANRFQRRSRLLTWLLYLGLAAGLVFACFPIVWMFFTSLKSNTEIFALPPRILPKVFTLRGLRLDLLRPGEASLLSQQLPRGRAW